MLERWRRDPRTTGIEGGARGGLAVLSAIYTGDPANPPDPKGSRHLRPVYRTHRRNPLRIPPLVARRSRAPPGNARGRPRGMRRLAPRLLSNALEGALPDIAPATLLAQVQAAW